MVAVLEKDITDIPEAVLKPELVTIPQTERAEVISLPGIIDMHVHLRQPGQEIKETFETGTKSALAGGVVAVFDMPNNAHDWRPYTHQRLVGKRALARRDAYVDIGFYAGSQPEDNNEGQLWAMQPLAHGLKFYIEPTTGNETEHDVNNFKDAATKWHEVARPTQPIIAHAEDRAIDATIELIAGEIGHPLHIPHVNNRFVLEAVMAAKRNELQVTAGVCPHHLFMTEKDVARLGWKARMKPPLATQEDQDFLWAHLDDIDVFETDHAPHTVDEKREADFKNPNADPDNPIKCYGVPGLDAILPLLLRAVKDRRLSMEQLIEKTSTRPAEILGLKVDPHTKVAVVMDDYLFGPGNIRSKCDWSPYLGFPVTGRVVQVDLHGQTVFSGGEYKTSSGVGQILINRPLGED